jgi:tRNA(fMet)-specific endonuclease VapC
VTVISYEEQTRGWFSYLAKARSPEAQITAYLRFKRHLENYCAYSVIEFDADAFLAFQKLKSLRLKIGTMDLKIASIALSRNAVLLTRNMADFGQVPGLRTDDWTLPYYEM